MNDQSKALLSDVMNTLLEDDKVGCVNDLLAYFNDP